MKILHINSYYSTSTFYKNLFDYQIKNGLDIGVYVPVPTSFDNHEFDYGSYTTISKNHNKYDRCFFHLKHNKIYKDLQQKYSIKDYSIIHAHSLFSNGYIAMKLKKRYSVPYIVAVRNTDVNLFFKNMIHLRKLGIQILKEANRIVFLSKPYSHQTIDKYVPKHLQKEIYNKVTVIPNGIDDYWLENVGTPKQKPDASNLRLIQVGDINKNKNVETTVKAIDILINKGYKVKLDVVGKIKNQNVFSRIKDLEYVNYLGYKSKEELIQIYRENDIFILPSIHETFGLVYAEAMSQGLPVIYSRGQGFDRQFQDGEVGFAVDCIDANEIAYKINSILLSYKLISTGCLRMVNKFDWNSIWLEFWNVYNKVGI